MKICGYVPCFNNAATLAAAVNSLLDQGLARDDLFVVDDGSTDDSPAVARSMNIAVKVNPQNLGRGYTRARAMREASHEMVLGCDATKTLAPGFLDLALNWMDSPDVAAVFGRIARKDQRNAAERWESRHIYQEHSPGEINLRASLVTAGALTRRSLVLQAGNYSEKLRHSEDAELGARLLGAGLKVVYDPGALIVQQGETRFLNLAERYWRWHAGSGERVGFRNYLRLISYSFKVLARDDCARRDYFGVPISLFMPHYQFWRSFRQSSRNAPK